MIPIELKRDKDGLLYTDDKNLIKDNMFLDKREIDLDQKYFTHGYFRLNSTLDYIIKYSYTELTKNQSDEFKMMLYELVSKQKDVLKTDFPIGYFRERKKVNGLIIKYYPNGISLDNLLKEHDINLIKNYYYLDDDMVHNVFLMLENLIDNICEMFYNGVYYTDINLGNFILTDNEIKVIDFEPANVKFDNRDLRLRYILQYLSSLIFKVLKEYELDSSFRDKTLSFEETKKMVKKLENNAREQNGLKRTF